MADNKKKKNEVPAENIMNDLAEYSLEDRNENRYNPLIVETPFGEYTVSVTLSLN